MYDDLMRELSSSTDVSFQEIRNKINSLSFDAELFEILNTTPDFISFYHKIQATEVNLLQNVSYVLLHNRLTNIQSLRTSRYI